MEISQSTLEEQLYLGHLESACPYLPDKRSNLLFLDGRPVGALYRILLDQGFRRHGWHLYRPDCSGCAECRVIRVPVERFVRSRSQERVWRKGKGIFRTEIGPPVVNEERMNVYAAYLRYQHATEEVRDEASYHDFFVETCLGENTIELSLYADDRLAGIGILDTLGDALSSVYFYFHPDFARYSPGTYSVLAEIELALEWKLRWYYPGYYIAGCRAMEYKANFYPHELRSADGWEIRTPREP